MNHSRLDKESQYFDRRFKSSRTYLRPRLRAIGSKGRNHYHALCAENCAGKRVLDVGCGKGINSLALARHGADVTGIDISAEGIRQATANAYADGLQDKAGFKVMNAEAMTFPDNHFDMVCGSAILHHLDIGNACREIARVLKPDGRAVFKEPLGHNPLINLYRWLTPGIRTDDERPLLFSDVAFISSHFQETHNRCFGLCTVLAVPFHGLPFFNGLLALLERIDDGLLRLPLVRRHARVVVFQLEHPKEYA